jgi:hypothetical protein
MGKYTFTIRGAMLFTIIFAIVLCTPVLAWNCLTENSVMPGFTSPSHQYIDEQAYRNLKNDPAFPAVRDRFPTLDRILANEGISVQGTLPDIRITGPGPDDSLNTPHSFHEYNPETRQGNTPLVAAFYYDSLQNGLVNGRDVSRDAAYLGHFIADVNCPYHINGMYPGDALQRLDSSNFSLGPEITGYCLPYSNVGAGRSVQPFHLGGLELRGSGGMGCTNWSRELDNWRLLHGQDPVTEDMFDPWYEDGIVSPELGSTHLKWEYNAWSNYSRPDYTVTGYAPEYRNIGGSGNRNNIDVFTREIANTTLRYQKDLLDESTQVADYNSSSILAQAYDRSITDVYTAWRSSFCALMPSVSLGNASETGDRKVIVTIRNLAKEPATNVWVRTDISGDKGSCLGGHGNEYYYGRIPAESEAVLGTLWTVKNTAGCYGKITASIEVLGDYKTTPDSGRAYTEEEFGNSPGLPVPDLIVFSRMIRPAQASSL